MDKTALIDKSVFTALDYVNGVIPGTDFIADDIIMELFTGIRRYKIENIKLNNLLLKILKGYGLGKESDESNVIENHPDSYKIILEAIRDLEDFKTVRFNKVDNSVTLTKLGESIVASFRLELAESISTVRAQYAEIKKMYDKAIPHMSLKERDAIDSGNTKIIAIRKNNEHGGSFLRPLKTAIMKAPDRTCDHGYVAQSLGKTTIKEMPDFTKWTKEQDILKSLMEINRACASLQTITSDFMIYMDRAIERNAADVRCYDDMIGNLIKELDEKIVKSSKAVNEFARL